MHSMQPTRQKTLDTRYYLLVDHIQHSFTVQVSVSLNFPIGDLVIGGLTGTFAGYGGFPVLRQMFMPINRSVHPIHPQVLLF